MIPLTPPKKSKRDILDLNEALKAALREFVTPSVEISFDIPDPDKLGEIPTINVFLYDVHEDLALNTSQSPIYNRDTHQFTPGYINLCCNYIITYWDKTQGEVTKATDSQAMTIMNQIINALINNRSLNGVSNARTRVMPPREELNGLGNFWQALGNKPRMVLNYSVTLPVQLVSAQENQPPVEAHEVVMEKMTTEKNQLINNQVIKPIFKD